MSPFMIKTRNSKIISINYDEARCTGKKDEYKERMILSTFVCIRNEYEYMFNIVTQPVIVN